MSVNPEYLEKPITAWRCGCRPESMHVGLSHKTCPYCRRPIPQAVCTQVYLQVLRELQAEALRIESGRWDRATRFTLKCKSFFRVATYLVIAVWVVMLFIVGIRNIPTIDEKLPDLFQIFPMLWQKLFGVGEALLNAFSETLQGTRWALLLNRLEMLPLDALVERLDLLINTAVKLIGLILERIADLFRLIGSLISSLLS